MISLIQKIQVSIEEKSFSAFFALLSYGFKLEVQIGCSLFELLVRQIGINESFLNEKVQTIFLNGKVVDDFSVEMVKDESVIALSAAMPGLAGAVFRKGGILASMRSEHASHQQINAITKHKGYVTLKLFNQIASELGADFFKKGICVKGKHFIRYVESKLSLLETVCRQLRIDGKQYEIGDLLSCCQPEADIVLTINSA
jgi:hypothetical protein